MEKTKLTKREYLGTGYWMKYKKNNAEEFSYLQISEEMYKLGPEVKTKKGYKFTNMTFGGNSLLDTSNGLGSLGDYFIKDGKYYVYEITSMFGNLNEVEYSEEEFNKKYV